MFTWARPIANDVTSVASFSRQESRLGGTTVLARYNNREVNNSPWLEWAQQLQAIAQIGLTYCRDPYDVGRYEAIREIAVEMMANGAGLKDASVIRDLFKGDVGYATPKVDVRAAVFN